MTTIGHWCLVIGHSICDCCYKIRTLQSKEFRMFAHHRRRRGFTLMEILLVLAILVVLGSMVGVGYVKIQQNAMKNSARAQITLLEDAVKTYMIDVGSPPAALDYLITSPPDLANPLKWQGPYLDKNQLPVDPWNQAYQYEV